jgi:hypothetical protein
MDVEGGESVASISCIDISQTPLMSRRATNGAKAAAAARRSGSGNALQRNVAEIRRGRAERPAGTALGQAGEGGDEIDSQRPGRDSDNAKAFFPSIRQEARSLRPRLSGLHQSMFQPVCQAV